MASLLSFVDHMAARRGLSIRNFNLECGLGTPRAAGPDAAGSGGSTPRPGSPVSSGSARTSMCSTPVRVTIDEGGGILERLTRMVDLAPDEIPMLQGRIDLLRGCAGKAYGDWLQAHGDESTTVSRGDTGPVPRLEECRRRLGLRDVRINLADPDPTGRRIRNRDRGGESTHRRAAEVDRVVPTDRRVRPLP